MTGTRGEGGGVQLYKFPGHLGKTMVVIFWWLFDNLYRCNLVPWLTTTCKNVLKIVIKSSEFIPLPMVTCSGVPKPAMGHALVHVVGVLILRMLRVCDIHVFMNYGHIFIS